MTKRTQEIIWEDPPDTKHLPSNRGHWSKILETVMTRPGEWARIAELPSVTARNLQQTLRTARTKRPPGRWEFATRKKKVGADTSRVYARYLGPVEPS